MMGEKLPKGWKKMVLGKVTIWGSGGTPSRGVSKYYNGIIPWFKTGDLNGGIISESSEFISEEGLKNSSAKLFPKDSIVMAMYGATIGKVAILGIEASTNQACAVAKPSDLIVNKFLFYFLKSQKKEFVEKGKGGAQPNISLTVIKNHSINIPPLPEQQRIVEKLDALFGHLDSLKEKLNRIPVLLKNFRQQVLTQAVTGELTREWREGKDLGEWEYEKAENCCLKVQSGGTPKSDGFAESGIPFLKVYNIVNNKIDFDYKPQFVSPEVHGKGIKKSILLPDDVLMNIVGPPLNKIAIVPDDYEEWNLNQAITLFRPKEHILNRFLYYFFCEGSSVRSVHNETRGVVGQVNISLSQCRKFEIPIPRLEEQKEIVSRIDALFDLAYNIESQYQTLKAKIEQLPHAILAKAFRGELVGQEVKEYVREAGEVLMAAEKNLFK